MAKTVQIDFDLDAGTFMVETAGFQGVGCKGIHEAFERMGTVVNSTPKPEYRQKPVAGNRLAAGR